MCRWGMRIAQSESYEKQMENRNESFKTESPEETQALGEKLGKTLQQGDVIALIGDLGTGKTCLNTRYRSRRRHRLR